MAKPNNKKRAGLQKKVSSVFKGVSVPGANRTGRPSPAPAKDDTAASSLPLSTDTHVLSDSAVKKNSQREKPTNRTASESLTVSAPPASTDAGSPQSPEVKKLVRPDESVDKAAPEHASTSATPMSLDTKSAPSPEVKKQVRPELSAGRTVTERASVFATPMSTDTSSSPSPEVKKLVRPDESADKAAPERSPLSPPPMTKSLESPEVGKLVRPEQSRGRSVSEHAATPPKPAPANHQSSQSSLLKRMAQCEESSDKSAQPKTETPSHKPAKARPKAPSHKPQEARTETQKSSYKPAPAEQLQDNVFADAGGLSLCQQIRDKVAASKLGSGSAKDKVMAMLVPVLAIIMVFAFRQVLRKSPGKARGAAQDETPVVAAANSGNEIEWELPKSLPAVMRDPLKLPGQDNEQGRDPNSVDNAQDPQQGSETVETETTDMRIRGLVYSEDKPSVVIGNKIAYVGARINGVTIVKINRDSVELEKDGETWVQTIHD